MRRMRKLLLKDLCRDYEQKVEFPKHAPEVERIAGMRLPKAVKAGTYRITFTEKIRGGYKVDIKTKKREVATGVKVRRWWETWLTDPVNENLVIMKLSLFCIKHRYFRMTVIDRREIERQRSAHNVGKGK